MDVLPLITNEQGWGREVAFRELCAVQGFLEEKQPPPVWQVAGMLLTSPSTGEAGTSCHRMAKKKKKK